MRRCDLRSAAIHTGALQLYDLIVVTSKPRLNSAQMNGQPILGFMILELKPGDTWTADIQAPLRGDIPGCEFSGIANVYPAPADPIPGSCDGGSPICRYRGWTTQARDLQRLFTILTAYDSNSISAHVVASDLGDAPASENNFVNTDMHAYSGVIANFPTVFNFNIGFPPELQSVDGPAADHYESPMHFQAVPMRLGYLASVEREADINPNRNLNPNQDQANLDFRDDGWAIGTLPASCEPFDQKIRITVEDWAVEHFQKIEGNAYLNVFVDANGDGDWEDTTNCGAETVPEHIFINLPIFITDLGAGQHEIELPANSGINWQTDQTWLRVTLSDQPAPLPLTTGEILHGDGRGPETGYLLGETEDYRLRVTEAAENVNAIEASGPDLGVRLNGEMNFFAFPVQHGQQLATIQEPANCLTCICAHIVTDHFMNIGNLGDLPAIGSSLVVMPDASLRDNEIEITVKGDLPWLEGELTSEATCAAGDPSCRVEIDLGDVPPGQFGSVIVSTAVTCHESVKGCKETDFLARAVVSTTGDNVEGNNTASKEWKLALPPDMMIQPNVSNPIPGTMSGSSLVVEGSGAIQPGGKVDVYLNGQIRGSGIAGNDNEWRVELKDVVEMYEVDSFQVAVGYELPDGLKNTTRPMDVIVDDTGMLHNGLSLKFAYDLDSKRFDFHPWDEAGRVDTNGWEIPLLAGTDTDVETEPHFWCLTCILSLEDPEIVLKINDNKVLAKLTDPDQDGTFSGSFTPEKEDLDQPITLHYTKDGVEQIYQGKSVAVDELPKLIDGETGQPVANTEVTLWEATRVTGGQILWERPLTVNGQPNPRITADDGSFFFNVAPGVYRLQFNNDSFHDGQFTGPQRLFGIYPSGNLVVNRPSFGNGLQSLLAENVLVSISSDGFNPPFIEAKTGDVLIFQNVSLQSRGLASEEGGIDSGFLPAGGEFALSFSQPGTFQIADPQDPQNTAVVTIIQGPVGDNIFLPAVLGR